MPLIISPWLFWLYFGGFGCFPFSNTPIILTDDSGQPQLNKEAIPLQLLCNLKYLCQHTLTWLHIHHLWPVSIVFYCYQEEAKQLRFSWDVQQYAFIAMLPFLSSRLSSEHHIFHYLNYHMLIGPDGQKVESTLEAFKKMHALPKVGDKPQYISASNLHLKVCFK